MGNSHVRFVDSLFKWRRMAQMRRHKGLALAICMLAWGQGCTVLTSELEETLVSEGRDPRGVKYYLPKTVIDLTLSVNLETASFRLVGDNPRSIADPRRSFYLTYRPMPQYEDKVTINLGPRGFLTSVIADTKDQTPGIILNLAKAFGAFGPGFEAASSRPNEQQLARLTVDPADEVDLAKATYKLNKTIHDFAKGAETPVCKPDPTAGIILGIVKQAQCAEYRAVLTKLRAGKPFIVVRSRRYTGRDACSSNPCGIEELGEDIKGGPGSPPEVAIPFLDADCTVGICYRAPEPVELWLVVGKSAKRDLLMIPNRARMVEIDIHRTFFVNKVQSIYFDETDGTLAKMEVNKPSELLALSTLPIEVLKAIVVGLQARIIIINNRIAEATATRELIAARGNLERQKAMFEASVRGASTGVVSQSSVPRLPTVQSGVFVDRVQSVDRP